MYSNKSKFVNVPGGSPLEKGGVKLEKEYIGFLRDRKKILEELIAEYKETGTAFTDKELHEKLEQVKRILKSREA